jgi:general secretion pathway protein I
MRSPVGVQSGFTLLEVLVALAVLAVALSAIITAAGQSAGNLSYLRDRTLAGWVAENTLNELLLAQAWPELNNLQGTAVMAGREWLWETRVSNTPDPDIRRLEVTVRATATGASPLAQVSAFKGRLE